LKKINIEIQQADNGGFICKIEHSKTGKRITIGKEKSINVAESEDKLMELIKNKVGKVFLLSNK